MLSPVHSVHYLRGWCIGPLCLQWLGFKLITIFSHFHPMSRGQVPTLNIRRFFCCMIHSKSNDNRRMHLKYSTYFNVLLVEVGQKKMKHSPVAQAPPNISRFAMRVWATWRIKLWESECSFCCVGCSCVALCGCLHVIGQAGSIVWATQIKHMFDGQANA